MMPSIPAKVVPTSILAYTTLFHFLVTRGPASSLRARHRAFSAIHATLASLAVLCALLSTDSPLRTKVNARHHISKLAPGENLDDGGNPLIQSRSDVANAITAWETGYLLFDTWAMIHYAEPTRRSFGKSLAAVCRGSPVLFGHHIGLSAAFAYLQYYIHRGRERGIWIIVAFLLMNASNPLLHARWWARQKGVKSLSLDSAFAAVFAASRFGSVAWVLNRYGAYHGLSALEAYRRLRLPCQMGTGALVGLNALWWVALMRGIMRRATRSSR